MSCGVKTRVLVGFLRRYKYDYDCVELAKRQCVNTTLNYNKDQMVEAG